MCRNIGLNRTSDFTLRIKSNYFYTFVEENYPVNRAKTNFTNLILFVKAKLFVADATVSQSNNGKSRSSSSGLG